MTIQEIKQYTPCKGLFSFTFWRSRREQLKERDPFTEPMIGWVFKFLKEPNVSAEDGWEMMDQLVAMEQGWDEAPEDDFTAPIHYMPTVSQDLDYLRNCSKNANAKAEEDRSFFDLPHYNRPASKCYPNTYCWIEIRRSHNPNWGRTSDEYYNCWQVFIKTINGRDLMVSKTYSPRLIDAKAIARKLAKATGLEVRK